MTFTLCSRGQNQKDRMGKEHGVAMEVERQSSVLITDPRTGNGTLGDGPSREESAQMGKGRHSLGAILDSYTDDRSAEPNNGVPLCTPLHRLYHISGASSHR